MKDNYVQRAVLEKEHTAVRKFAGRIVLFTIIANSLYLTLLQICDLLGLSEKATRNGINTIYAEADEQNKGGGVERPPLFLIIYEAEVTFQPVARVGGGGGTQTQKFYHHELIIRIAERMRMTQRKALVLNWMRGIVSEYVQYGAAIDDYAVANDPIAMKQLVGRVAAHNFSPERWNMVSMNKDISQLLYKCSGVYDRDGLIIPSVWRYFHQCCHNTAHISAVGMAALQLRAARADPTSPTFGQENFRGKFAPHTSELNNACNFLHQDELKVRCSVISGSVGRVLGYIRQHGDIEYHTALKMFTMHSVSVYNPYISWDYRDYPETAIDNILSVTDKSVFKDATRNAIKVYLDNFPNRHILTESVSLEYNAAIECLVQESISGVDTVILDI